MAIGVIAESPDNPITPERLPFVPITTNGGRFVFLEAEVETTFDYTFGNSLSCECAKNPAVRSGIKTGQNGVLWGCQKCLSAQLPQPQMQVGTESECHACAQPSRDRRGVLLGREGVAWICPKCLPNVLRELKRFDADKVKP